MGSGEIVEQINKSVKEGMRILDNIDSEKIIALDIETVRIAKDLGDAEELYQEAWSYKNKQDGEIPTDEHAAELWHKQASLYAEFSKVCTVSVTYMHKGELRCRSFASYSEAALLRELAGMLDKLYEKGGYKLLGHAMKYFDVPFLCKRYIINHMKPPLILDASGCKPWEMDWILDTNELWRGFGTGPGSSLFALCVCLGVEVSKVDMVGDEVGKAYYNGELERISQYCNLDAIATYNVFRRFKLEPQILQSDVKYDTQGELIEPVPLIESISNTKNITAPQEKILSDYIKGLPEGDKEIIRNILRAAVVDDKGEIKASLEKKINLL
jgi:hypothetical protein